MADFEVNDLVQHPQFGIGTVTGFSKFEDGRAVVVVNFERVGKKKLLIEYAELQKITQEYIDEKKANHDNWPDSTFVHEEEGHAHYLGSHWKPFCENQEILKNLPLYLSDAIVLEGYGSFFPSPLAQRENTKKYFQLNTPNHDMGISLVLEPTPDGNTIKTLYPFCSKGSQVGLVLKCVHIWDGGYEAQIEADWQGLSVCFFDTRFIHNRAWYVAAEMYEFILTAIAYHAKPAERRVLKIHHKPEVIQKLIEVGVIEHAEDLSDELDTSQAMMFLPIEEWDRDDYSFQGKLKQLVPFDDFLGQPGWIAIVTVMVSPDGELPQDLKIILTKRVWQTESPPEVGTYIQGSLWLQGYMWNVANKHHF